VVSQLKYSLAGGVTSQLLVNGDRHIRLSACNYLNI